MRGKKKQNVRTARRWQTQEQPSNEPNGRVRLFSLVGLIGAILLTVIAYASAGNTAVELVGKWASSLREFTLGAYLKIPRAKEAILSKHVSRIYGASMCIDAHDVVDLDRNGLSSDIVVTLVPKEISPDCQTGTKPSALALRQSGWGWRPLDPISIEISPAATSWHNGYIFFEGPVGPGFAIFGYQGDELVEVHSDFGELPDDKKALFPFPEEDAMLVSSRRADKIIRFNVEERVFELEDVKFEEGEFSRKSALISTDDGSWGQGYSFNGERLEPEEGVVLYPEGLRETDFVYVPYHCDAEGLTPVSGFPGYHRRKPDQQVARICCDLYLDYWGACSGNPAQTDYPWALEIELSAGGRE